MDHTPSDHLENGSAPEHSNKEKQARRVQERPHQRAAIDDAVGCLSSGTRAQVHMACGTGKTLVGIRVLEHFLIPGHAALVMVPSLALVDQWVRSFRAAGEVRVRLLAVCSDSDVGSVDDDAGISREDLTIPSTTIAQEVAHTLAEWAQAGEPTVVIATYASSDVLREVAREHDVPPWAVAVCDEAHRTAGVSRSQEGRRWSTVLLDHLIPARRRLFLTATPRIHAVHAGAGGEQDSRTVASMDDEALYGSVAHVLPFRDAVDRGLLNDFRIVIMAVDDEEIGRALAGVQRGDAKRLATQVVVAKIAARYQLASVLVFHNRISRSQRFAASLPSVVDSFAASRPEGTRALLGCHHVEGKTPRRSREAAFDQIRNAHTRNGWSVISNCRCVAEGVDLPALDAVVIADARRSAVDVTQVVGRAMRRATHRHGPSYVVLPVYLSPGEDEESALLSSDFSHAYQVLTALSDHDELLAEELRQVRQAAAREPRSAPELSRIEVILPEHYTARAVATVSGHIVQKTTSSFWAWYGLLLNHADQFGHSRVTKDYRTERGDALGNWVRTQRADYQAGRLSPERQAALEEVKGWVWKVNEDSWMRQYTELMSFAERNGHARPPRDHPLASWVQSQRGGINAGWLTAERRDLLDRLPGWAWRATEAAWEEGLAELVAYAAEHGTAAVPSGYVTSSGYKLGNWVVNQRRRRRDGRMRSSEPGRLEALSGWTWDPATDQWGAAFQRVQGKWGADGGAIRDDSDLTTWIANQRRVQRRGDLSEERQHLLSSLPGWRWEPKDDAWEDAFEATADFLHVHKHTAVGGDLRTPSGVQVRQWITRQRRDYKDGTLSSDQVRRLESLPGWTWEPWEQAWQTRYEELRRYVAEHGTARMSPQYRTPEGFALGEWARSQRRRIASGLALEHQRTMLEELPGFVR